MTYYRLLDTQNDGQVMAVGENATSLEDLTGQYADYKRTADELTENWEMLSMKDRIQEIKDDEFEIEESLTKFKEQNI